MFRSERTTPIQVIMSTVRTATIYGKSRIFHVPTFLYLLRLYIRNKHTIVICGWLNNAKQSVKIVYTTQATKNLSFILLIMTKSAYTYRKL